MLRGTIIVFQRKGGIKKFQKTPGGVLLVFENIRPKNCEKNQGGM